MAFDSSTIPYMISCLISKQKKEYQDEIDELKRSIGDVIKEHEAHDQAHNQNMINILTRLEQLEAKKSRWFR